MKKQLLISILLFGGILSNYAQGLYNIATLDDELDDYPSTWFIDISYGVPSGDTSDFHSSAYGVDLGYFSGINNSSFYVGAEVGYLRFTGKDTDFGFETDGVGFIPVKGKFGYNFLESFGLEGGAGYAFSADDGDGDAIYEVGINWYPIEKLTFSIMYSSVGGDFDEFAIGIRRTF